MPKPLKEINSILYEILNFDSDKDKTYLLNVFLSSENFLKNVDVLIDDEELAKKFFDFSKIVNNIFPNYLFVILEILNRIKIQENKKYKFFSYKYIDLYVNFLNDENIKNYSILFYATKLLFSSEDDIAKLKDTINTFYGKILKKNFSSALYETNCYEKGTFKKLEENSLLNEFINISLTCLLERRFSDWYLVRFFNHFSNDLDFNLEKIFQMCLKKIDKNELFSYYSAIEYVLKTKDLLYPDDLLLKNLCYLINYLPHSFLTNFIDNNLNTKNNVFNKKLIIFIVSTNVIDFSEYLVKLPELFKNDSELFYELYSLLNKNKNLFLSYMQNNYLLSKKKHYIKDILSQFPMKIIESINYENREITLCRKIQLCSIFNDNINYHLKQNELFEIFKTDYPNLQINFNLEKNDYSLIDINNDLNNKTIKKLKKIDNANEFLDFVCNNYNKYTYEILDAVSKTKFKNELLASLTNNQKYINKFPVELIKQIFNSNINKELSSNSILNSFKLGIMLKQYVIPEEKEKFDNVLINSLFIKVTNNINDYNLDENEQYGEIYNFLIQYLNKERLFFEPFNTIITINDLNFFDIYTILIFISTKTNYDNSIKIHLEKDLSKYQESMISIIIFNISTLLKIDEERSIKTLKNFFKINSNEELKNKVSNYFNYCNLDYNTLIILLKNGIIEEIVHTNNTPVISRLFSSLLNLYIFYDEYYNLKQSNFDCFKNNENILDLLGWYLNRYKIYFETSNKRLESLKDFILTIKVKNNLDGTILLDELFDLFSKVEKRANSDTCFTFLNIFLESKKEAHCSHKFLKILKRFNFDISKQNSLIYKFLINIENIFYSEKNDILELYDLIQNMEEGKRDIKTHLNKITTIFYDLI